MDKRIVKILIVICAVLVLLVACCFECKSKGYSQTISRRPTIHDEILGISGNFKDDVEDGLVYCDEYGTIINPYGFPINTYNTISCDEDSRLIYRNTGIAINGYYIDETRQVHVFKGGDLEW